MGLGPGSGELAGVTPGPKGLPGGRRRCRAQVTARQVTWPRAGLPGTGGRSHPRGRGWCDSSSLTGKCQLLCAAGNSAACGSPRPPPGPPGWGAAFPSPSVLAPSGSAASAWKRRVSPGTGLAEPSAAEGLHLTSALRFIGMLTNTPEGRAAGAASGLGRPGWGHTSALAPGPGAGETLVPLLLLPVCSAGPGHRSGHHTQPPSSLLRPPRP